MGNGIGSRTQYEFGGQLKTSGVVQYLVCVEEGEGLRIQCLRNGKGSQNDTILVRVWRTVKDSASKMCWIMSSDNGRKRPWVKIFRVS